MDIQPVKGTLLSALAPADHEYLLSLGVRRRFTENEVLLRQGDPTDHVLIVLAGWVRAYSTNQEGQEVVLAVRGPGDVLGELAALHGWPRTVSLRAMEQVHVVQLRRRQFLDCLHERPEIALALLKQMSVRLHDAEMALLEFATQDVGKRVAGYLLRMTRQHGVRTADGIEVGVPLSQQEIASRIGASPRAVARTMAILRERGIVATAPRRIVIVRPDVLRSFTGHSPNGT
jgi:CRP/FNR family transcriptional regulator, cyclic AMP receptor protein